MDSKLARSDPFFKGFKINKCLYSSEQFNEEGRREDEIISREKGNANDKLICKKFKERPSKLTTLLEIREFRTIYNIFIVLLINYMSYNFIVDYFVEGQIDLGLSNIIWLFGKPYQTFKTVLILHLAPLVILYPLLSIWGKFRNKISGVIQNWDWDAAFALLGLIFTTLFIYYPWRVTLGQNFPPASCTIIAAEQLRILLKMYAFVRHNIGKSEDEIETSKFTSFLYFLYAPTLIYQDFYPRTKQIRWKFVFTNFLNTIFCVILYNLIQKHGGHSYFKNFGKPGHKFTLKEFVGGLFNMIYCSAIAYYLGTFILFHCWQNMIAELLKFADRQFYKDWWNSISFQDFYRTQNVIVQNFIYIYIYKDLREKLNFSKTGATLLVFTISVILHEYGMAFSLQFFMPANLIFFGGFGIIFAFINNTNFPRLGNIFFHWGLYFGGGIIFTMYQIEYYARVNNCPPTSKNFMKDFFWPRSISCFPY